MMSKFKSGTSFDALLLTIVKLITTVLGLLVIRIISEYFSYSDYEIQQGYHNAKSHGGVISGDGQYLKIGYVQPYPFSRNDNVIVYIEELSPPC